MIFECQTSPMKSLEHLAQSDRHSLILEGISGCGKTYLCKQFANMIQCQDVVNVKPTVNDIRSTIESCYSIKNTVVVCIENLDSGVAAAAYTLLKFLEEPASNVYIIITCRSLTKIPDTIISRSAVVSVPPPKQEDLVSFAKNRDNNKFKIYSRDPVWQVVKSFSDIDYIYKLSIDDTNYLSELRSSLLDGTLAKNSISTIAWNLGHYPDNRDLDARFILNYVLHSIEDAYLYRVCLDLLNDLEYVRIGSNAVITKFAFELKYGGY